MLHVAEKMFDYRAGAGLRRVHVRLVAELRQQHEHRIAVPDQHPDNPDLDAHLLDGALHHGAVYPTALGTPLPGQSDERALRPGGVQLQRSHHVSKYFGIGYMVRQ